MSTRRLLSADPRLRTISALVYGLVCAGAVTTALASENYPTIIDRHTGVDCPRPLTRCLICHDTAAGGEETANQPFAIALVEEFGLSGGKAGRELAAALETLPTDLDTDADGTPDQEELASCRNPSGEELSEGPGYGCVASIAGGQPPMRHDGLWATIAALMLVARRRVNRFAKS